jgi:type VI secretion system protein ImpC
LVSGLSAHSYATPEDKVARIGPTDATISDELESGLVAAGFIPLVSCRNTDYAVVFSTPSCYSPPRDSAPEAHLIAQLPYVFAGSRIAQYINVMIRDKIGSFQSKTDCEVFLKNWISRYTTPDEGASDDVKGQFPLRYGDIKVSDVPGRPGHYSAVLYVTPHFQLKDLAEPIRLFVDLPKPVRSDRTYS